MKLQICKYRKYKKGYAAMTGNIRTEEMITGVEDEGEIRTEEMITGVEDEGEIRSEERKEICSGATLMATHAYTRNPESRIGKEIDLQQWDTVIFKGEHTENEHWRLVEDRNWQVGYAPATFLVVILDTTAEEEESDATKKGQENSPEENRIGGWIMKEELFSGYECINNVFILLVTPCTLR